jgi:hypothetical protein
MNYKSLVAVLMCSLASGCDDNDRNSQKKQYYVYEVDRDRAPELSLGFSVILEDNNKGITGMNVYKLKLSSVLPVSDVSGDRLYDIMSVIASRKEAGKDKEVEFYRSNWDKNPNFNGNDL